MNTKMLKEDFEILKRNINGKMLVYLDNAATTQKPRCVTQAIVDYYNKNNANVHRGIHTLSEESTLLYENARKKVSDFLGSACPKEVIFTSNTTNSLNMAAIMLGEKFLTKGDVILTTEIEHHSNFLPWQQIADKKGAKLEIVDVYGKDNSSIVKSFKQKMTDRVKLVAVTHISNVTSATLPIKDIVTAAHEVGALVIVDGAQSVPHMSVNVKNLGCDVLAFSGHKMLSSTGIGVLWIRQDLMEKLNPVCFGGGMIDEVTLEKSTWTEIPFRFEAGTPNIEGAISLGVAIDYLNKIGMDNIRKHEIELSEYALGRLSGIEGINIIGPENVQDRCGIISFTIRGIHSHDIASICDSEGIAVRSGHHCAMILHNKLGLSATTRASFYFYNDKSDLDKLYGALLQAQKILT